MTPESELFERLKDTNKPTVPPEVTGMEAELSAPVSIKNIFTHHDTHPIVIDFALLKAFGPEWLTWDTITVYQEIQRVFGSQISEHARVKIQALKTLHNTSSPWTSWQVFEKVSQALNNNIPRWEFMQAPSIEQLYATVDIMDSLRKEEFADEVKMYMAAAVLNEDVFFVPPPLDFIQMEVSQPKYKCLDCDNEDSALFHDGLCDTCTNKYSEENGFSFRPDQDLVEQGKGKNLTLKLTFDPDPIQMRWFEVEKLPVDQVNLEENQVDIQVSKLLMAKDYLNLRRKQLAEQLTSLKSWLGSV